MRGDVTVSKQQISSLELLALCGCGLFFAWMFCAFYWLVPVSYDAAGSEGDAGLRGVVQLFAFLGLAAGYAGQWMLAKSPRFSPYRPAVLLFDAACLALVPATALCAACGTIPSAPIQAAACFLAGVGAAFVTNGWLDAPSLFRCERLARFYSLGVLSGCALFASIAFLPLAAQAAFSAVFGLASVGLLHFVASRDEVKSRPRASHPPVDTWTRQNVREIEPSLVTFNMVFGLGFCVLANEQMLVLFLGLASAMAGALLVLVLDCLGVKTNIVVFQRLLLTVDVVTCVVYPFVPEGAKPVCACCVVASWAAFLSVNYEHMVKKGMLEYDVPVFRQLPQRVIFAASGFAAGWALAAGFTVLYGVGAGEFTLLFLAMVIVLVLVVMVFFPVDNHHLKAEGPQAAEQAGGKPAAADRPSEDEAFQRRIALIARRFGLSARETEVLSLMAKGRNAAYIRDKLVLSPYTVKTHMYHVYTKLDIHTQQKVIDFVEAYVEDADSPVLPV